MEFDRKWYKILVFKRWITYHVKINWKELRINLGDEDNARIYACWYVDCLYNIREYKMKDWIF